MRVELSVESENRIRGALRKAGRRECGGMLLAEQFEPGRFRVIDLSIDTESGEHAHFERRPEIHAAARDAFFKRTGHDYSRFNHLGEWHSHPSFNVSPSLEDMSTMASLVASGPISFAVLLIVRLRFNIWLEYSLTLFARGYAPQPMRFRRIVQLI
jgi:hypothetical protein